MEWSGVEWSGESVCCCFDLGASITMREGWKERGGR